jgi:hypothetical protein
LGPAEESTPDVEASQTEERHEAFRGVLRQPWQFFVPVAMLRVVLRVLIRALPLLLIIFAYGLGMSWAPSEAGKDYFSAAAQVVPVLLLALAVESQMLNIRSLFVFEPMPLYSAENRQAMETSGATPRWMVRAVFRFDTVVGWFNGALYAVMPVGVGLAVIGALVYAEWRCLGILASIGDGKRDPELVSGGVLAGLVGVGLLALFGRRERDSAPTGDDGVQ